MTCRRINLAVAALVLGAAPTYAETCGAHERGAGTKRSCPPSAGRFELYDPDRVRSGRTPGFIDLGNGTEVRISGRARLDYDVRTGR